MSSIDRVEVPLRVRLWTAARFQVRLDDAEGLIDRLQSQDQSFRRQGLGKTAFRLDTSRNDGFKLVRFRRTLWYPAMAEAVMAARSDDQSLTADVRLPYPIVGMAGIMVGLGLILGAFADGMGIAALVLWGGFGSLWFLTNRLALPKKADDFLSRLEQALAGTAAAREAAPTEAAPSPPASLFRSKVSAGLYLAALTAFWGGFLLISFADVWKRPYSASHPVDPFGAVALCVLLAGFVSLPIVNLRLQRRVEDSRSPGLRAFLATINPRTMMDAAAVLGIPRVATVIVLYGLLAVGMVSFFAHVMFVRLR